MSTLGVIDDGMSEEERQRLNLYLPVEDGKEILRRARYAAADAGVRLNSWFFRAIRKELGLPEPQKPKKAKAKKK